jgi:hypothetical protein
MKYAVFKNNQFIKLADEITLTNPDYMYYEIDTTELIDELEDIALMKIKQKSFSLLQRIKFLFTGKL